MEEEILKIAEFVNQLNFEYELLKYHRLGLPKYDSLHREYPMGDVELDDEKFKKIKMRVAEQF